MYISDQMLQSADEVTLLHRLVSYHVAYHLNEVHFAQYRVLGSIFPDLHGLVVDQLAHQLQGTAPAASSTFIPEACHVSQSTHLVHYNECILMFETLLNVFLPFCTASRLTCRATAIRANCTKASE